MGWLRRRREAPLDCREVARVLESYLDAELDDAMAARMAEHLEQCRRCGLEATTYLEIRRCLTGRTPALTDESVARLRGFADRLCAGGGLGTDPMGR